MIIAELIAFLVAGFPFLQDNISLHTGRVAQLLTLHWSFI